MSPDDEVCLCFHVSLRKIRTFLEREDPPVASLISECLGAGTGCHWCVPVLKRLHQMHVNGELPDLKASPADYADRRKSFHKTGVRELRPDEGDDGPLLPPGAEGEGGRPKA